MAEVLAEHQQKTGIRDMRSHCWCGWAGEMTGRAFIEHQAAALTAAGHGPIQEARAAALEDAAAIAGRPENRWWAEGQNRAKWLRSLAAAELDQPVASSRNSGRAREGGVRDA